VDFATQAQEKACIHRTVLMPTIIAMLRGVNLGGHNLIRMETLRALCSTCKFENAQTYLQSGNAIFTTKERNLGAIGKRLEEAIERELGFRPAVVLRTLPAMHDVIARNPFAKREGIDNSKFAVTFFAEAISPEIRKQIEAIKVGPEEIHALERELYIYNPDGLGNSKLSAAIDKVMKKTGTGRNWNSVPKMTEMAEKMAAN
jgi:uncharacterized protein (DUF1697 family)